MSWVRPGTGLLTGGANVSLKAAGDPKEGAALTGASLSEISEYGAGVPEALLAIAKGDGGASASIDRFRFDDLPLDGNGDFTGEDSAGLSTSDLPLDIFSGVDSSSGLRPPRKSSSSKSEDPSSSCIMWRILACRGRRLKLLNMELSKAGVPGTLELASPLRPAIERVEE
jgi:hypothetical protein